MVKESKILNAIYILYLRLKDVFEKSIIVGIFMTIFSKIFDMLASSAIVGLFAGENKMAATVRPLHPDNRLLSILNGSTFISLLKKLNSYYVLEHVYILSIIFIPTTVSVALGIVLIVNSIFRAFEEGLSLTLTHILVLSFSFIMLISGLYGLYPKQALLVTAIYTVYTLVTVFMTSVSSDRTKLIEMTYGLVVSVAIASLYGFYQYIVGVEIDPSWVDTKMFNSTSRIFSVFNNPNVYGIFLVLVLPVILGLAMRTKNKYIKGLFYITFACGFVNIFLTMSRGSMVGIVFGLFMMAIFIDRRFFYVALALVLISPFVLPASIVNRIMSIGNLKESSSAYRISIYVATIKMIRDFLVAGVGLGSFKMVFHYYAFAASKSFHAHNTFLMVFAENGLIGFILYVLILVSFSRDVLFPAIHTKSKDRYLLLGIVGGVVGSTVQGLFEHIWHNYDVMFIYFLLILIGASLGRMMLKEEYYDKSSSCSK